MLFVLLGCAFRSVSFFGKFLLGGMAFCWYLLGCLVTIVLFFDVLVAGSKFLALIFLGRFSGHRFFSVFLVL